MKTETYPGVVRGGTVVLLTDSPPLTDGTEVLVMPVSRTPGTAAAVLAAVSASPSVPAAWVDELETAPASSSIRISVSAFTIFRSFMPCAPSVRAKIR